jgi:hypothetical protein
MNDKNLHITTKKLLKLLRPKFINKLDRLAVEFFCVRAERKTLSQLNTNVMLQMLCSATNVLLGQNALAYCGRNGFIRLVQLKVNE